MTLGSAWIEYRDAVRAFSRPARLFLLATLLTWASHGVAQVLFNLFLVEAGYREAFVGRAVSLTGLGLALTALPAGVLAERWGHRPTLILGAALEGIAMLVRALAPTPGIIAAASFAAGSGQALLAIAAAPFLSEHSTARERTHLFSTFFAIELVAGVVAALGQEAVGGHPVDARVVQGVAADGDLDQSAAARPLEIVGRAEARGLDEPTFQREALLQDLAELPSRHLHRHQAVDEGQGVEHVASGHRTLGQVRAQAPGVGDRDLGPRPLAHDIGHEASERRLGQVVAHQAHG